MEFPGTIPDNRERGFLVLHSPTSGQMAGYMGGVMHSFRMEAETAYFPQPSQECVLLNPALKTMNQPMARVSIAIPFANVT